MSDRDKPTPLKDLQSRLRAARGNQPPRGAGQARDGAEQDGAEQDGAGRRSAMGYAFRVGIELTAGLVVGGMIGWALDLWLGTSPAFLIVFFFLGAAAGIRNVFRTAMELNRRPPGQGN